ncbi:MAG: MG2 domain-containing protein [Saprospiraceae bacterium]|nr:MG2 domain-containing protein [Saprospiraceae bacterium]
MKKSLFVLLSAFMLLVGTLTAQNMTNNNTANDYPAEWKDIEKLEADGLPKSALEKVEALFKRAKSENNASQIVKTLIFRAKYTAELDEEGFVKAVNALRAETDAAALPVKNVLQSMLGELYAGYLESNVWRMRGRTATPTFKTDDIRTWTIAQLNDEAALLYRLSVNDETTRQIPIQNFAAVVTEGSADNFRPTLYDFLAHRAVDFFQDDKSYLAKPAYKFELDTEGVFLPASDFTKINFDSPDSTSGKLWALRLLQDIVRFHLRDGQKDALIDADLKRLEFVYANSVLDNKTDLYQKALESLRSANADNAAYAEITLRLARLHQDLAQKWKPTPNNPYRLSNKTALDMSREAVNRYKKAYGANGLRALIDQILTPSVEIRTEEVVVPNKPILASVQFKNVDSMHYKIIRLYERVSRREFEDETERLKFYNNQPFVTRKTVKLPNSGDYNPHTTELKIEKLPLGMYLVLASDNARFSNKNGGKVTYMTFHVSNISFFHRTGDTEANQFVVVDRSSGQALSGVTVEFWESKYNAQTRKDVRIKIGNAVSDRDGFVFPRLPKEKYYTLRFVYGKDTLSTGDGYSNYFYKPEKQTIRHTHFFLDRAIYRPNQTIFYKGILIEKDQNTEGGAAPRIVPNEEVEVTLYDVNGQKVTTNKLITNEFGTINGSFVAPSSGLLGGMSISSSLGGAIGFRVEEYKRPKFEVKIEPLEGSYILDQNVVVKGTGKGICRVKY